MVLNQNRTHFTDYVKFYGNGQLLKKVKCFKHLGCLKKKKKLIFENERRYGEL